MTQGDQSGGAKRKPRRATKAEVQAREAAYQRGVHDGQMAAFTMMTFIAHPDLLSELLEGRATALASALRAIGGDQARVEGNDDA